MDSIRGLQEKLKKEEKSGSFISNKKPTNEQNKEKKNPGKRPPNAFLLYCGDYRQKIQEENPGMSLIEVSQLLAKKWKELDKAEMDKYKEKAKQQLEEFKKNNPNAKYNSKSHRPQKYKQIGPINDSLQIFDHIFQTNPFLLQQILLEKDNKGRPDIYKMLSID